ncbi:MAG: hypothetical protein QNJ55_17440 [Xenococcus sp. MO_188.B8]|nr:hypothetical protein [Xenococcus sp. MO_188.B8]
MSSKLSKANLYIGLIALLIGTGVTLFALIRGQALQEVTIMDWLTFKLYRPLERDNPLPDSVQEKPGNPTYNQPIVIPQPSINPDGHNQGQDIGEVLQQTGDFIDCLDRRESVCSVYGNDL